jgi:hypothetical protein
MREKKIIDLHKILYPEKYNTSYVYTFQSFNKELEELIGKSGFVKEFKTKYFKSLRFLENLKKRCIMNSNLFEELLQSEGIYSIILKGEKNIRILFDFTEVEGNEVVILFNCFQEKSTKDYADEIEIAKARRRELLDI